MGHVVQMEVEIWTKCWMSGFPLSYVHKNLTGRSSAARAVDRAHKIQKVITVRHLGREFGQPYPYWHVSWISVRFVIFAIFAFIYAFFIVFLAFCAPAAPQTRRTTLGMTQYASETDGPRLSSTNWTFVATQASWRKILLREWPFAH